MTIKKTLLAASLGMLFAAFSPAQAAVQTYNFIGTFDSGALVDLSFGGTLSFDDATLTGIGEEWIGVSDLIAFLPGALALFTAADAVVPAEVGFDNGVFLGLSASFNGADSQFTFIADANVPFLAYDMTDTNLLSGAGNVMYAAPVPEPESWAMVLMGLGLVGLRLRRINKSLENTPLEG